MKRIMPLLSSLVFVLSACTPGGPLAPATATPTLTSTAIPSPTSTATKTPEPTLTNTPVPTETNTPTLTPTSIYNKVVFEDDFVKDKMGWEGRKFVTGYGNGQISFDFPADKDPKKIYYGSWTTPKHGRSLNGDGIVEVTIDQPVRFSGIFFINSKSKINYAFIIGAGDNLDTWKSNRPSLGLLIPSNKENPWEELSKTNSVWDVIEEKSGVITFRVEFVEDQATVYINDKFIASRTNRVFSGTKIIGITVGNGDKFNVTEMKILGPGE